MQNNKQIGVYNKMFFKMRLEVSAIILTRICKIQLHPNMQRAVKLPGIHEQIHFAEEEEL